MNNNTNCANSRPRSVKPKKRSGFTMMEMMITLAIMTILFGLAVPAVAQIQKNLEMARLNSYAKDIYLAAQNRLMSLKATGELASVRDDLETNYSGLEGKVDRYYGDWDERAEYIFKPQDWEDDWEERYQNFYGVMHNPNNASDDDAIITSLIPELSVSNTYLDHHYYIEFNPATGDVYAVFYTDAKLGFCSQDILDGAWLEDEETGREKADLRDHFITQNNGANEKVMVGYYRGDPTEMLKDQIVDEFVVTCDLVNKEDLYVKVTGQLDWDSFNHRKYVDTKVTLTETKNGVTNTVAIPIDLRQSDSLSTYDRGKLSMNNYIMYQNNSNGSGESIPYMFVAYIMLDSLDDSANFEALLNNEDVTVVEGTKAAFVADFNAGCDLKAAITMEYDFAGRVVRNTDDNESELQNSRFGAIVSSGNTNDVYVGFVRHLKNLSDYVLPSGNALTIKQIRTEYVWKTVVDELTGEEHQERVKEEGPADIHFSANYEGPSGVKPYWDPDYLIGEPAGDFLRNYMNAPSIDNQAYMLPIHLQLNGNKTFTYEGNYKGLYDFVIANPDGGDIGLFDSVTRAKFENANLIDAIVDGGDAGISVGGFAGEANVSEFYYCGVRLTDRDPYNNERYEGMDARVSTLTVASDGADCIGGMVGYAENCQFYYSYAAVQVEGGDTSTAGGMVGYSKTCDFCGCYTSEPTIGGLNVGGFVGMMEGGEVKENANGTEAYPTYATGDAIGVGNVGGFVGSAKNSAKFVGCNSYGRARSAEGATSAKLGGFVAVSNGGIFTDCSYLQQSRYNKGTGYVSQEGLAAAHDYDDEFTVGTAGNNFWNVLADTNADNDNDVANSYPYTIAARADVFPFMMAHEAYVNPNTGNIDDYPVMPHYGDWPVEANIQTMLAYYEVDEEGVTRLYGFTSLAGDDEDKANSWKLDTLLRGDVSCVEDGYAIVSTDTLTNISGTIESLNNTTVNINTSPSLAADVKFEAEGQSRNEHVYIYKLTDLDVQGMSQAYQTAMNDQNGTFYQKMVLTGKNNSDEMFSNYTFYYCPVLAKSAINPTPKQADDQALCPSAKAKDNEAKPDAGIIRSARQLNAMGRMNWFWNMNLNQECHVDFGTYTHNYCGTSIDLSGSGQGTTNLWRNKPIGSNTTTYGQKPYTGNYNGNAFKIIDYCLYTTGANDSVDAGLFGVLRQGSIKNVVLMASDPNANSGAGTAWVKSDMTQGNDAYHIAPLVGLVEYGFNDYSSAGSQARSLKSWNVGSDVLKQDNISGNCFSFSGDSMVGDGGKWLNAKGDLTPQNTQQYLQVTLKGNFGVVDSATLVTKKVINQYTPDVIHSTSTATDIKDGEITFRVEMTDILLETTPEVVDPTTGAVTPAESKRKLGDNVVITLTGGSTETWLVSETSFKAEKFSTEPVVPTGDNPASFITGIANMSTVSNCAVAGYIVEYNPSGTQNSPAQIGGFVGKNQGEIYNCSASNKSVSANGSSGSQVRLIGGFAGENNEGVIADCYSGGLLVATGTQPAYVGGIVGKNEKGESKAWRTAYTQLISCYSFCSMEDNASSNVHFYGVAGGNNSDSYVKHCHFYNELSCFKDYSRDDHPFLALYNKLEDKDLTYAATIRGNSVTIPYALTYVKMKALSQGNAYALSGTTGTANFDHSWPYDTTLVGDFPFAAVVLDDDGYYVHYGDWPAPIGTIYSNSASFGGVFWADFCVDATHKTDYNYYWGDWLKEMMYQCGLGPFKEGDYVEIIVEPEFKYDAPEAGGLFQCAVHSMMVKPNLNVWDAENDACYEAQGITFGNGQVYQFLFDVNEQTINILNDPQLWFAINYHQKGGIDASLWEGVKGNYFDEDGEPAGNEDPFRINRLTVNVYRDSSTTRTDTTTRHSTTTLGEGETTSVEEATHLETLKTWDFEPVNGDSADNILSTGEGTMVAGVISDALFAGSAASGHSNMISLNKAKDFHMNISDAFSNEPILGKNEYYQVEATFALGDNAPDNLYIRPYLVSGSDSYYASTYTLVQKRAETGANAGKVIWATGVYTFGHEGVAIDDDAYIVWIPREVGDQTHPNTLTGDLYVDNVAVKKVVPGADPSATASTKATVPASDDEAKLIYYWACDQASSIVLPTYDVSPKNTYRYINVGGKDLTTGVSWSDFLKMHDSLTETQYMVVTLEYPEGYAHAEKSNFTFTCDAYAYGENQTLAEIDAASGEDAFDAENHTVKWVINGPLSRSAGANYGGAVTLKTYFAYRNAQDLVNSNTLINNKEDFNISVGIYDRDPNATAMTVPTTTASRTTKQLSGGTAVHTFAADQLGHDNYMSFNGADVGYVDDNRATTMTWNEFVNYVGALGDTQYLRVTITNNDSAFSGLNLVDQKISVNAYRGVDGKVIKGEPAKSTNATTIVYQVNGPLDLNTVATDGAKEGYNDAGIVFGGMPDTLRVGDKTSILVEIMSTATTAQLQGDSFDVLANDVISKTVTITLNGDTFSSGLVMNSDITHWFNGLGGRGLSAKLLSVNGNVAQISIVGTVTETPASDVTVTATVPGDVTTKGGNDIAASGSFIISKKVPKASIVGEEASRAFYVNEAGQAVVNISVANTTFGSVAGFAESAWVDGTLPSGLSLTQVAKINDNTVTLTFSGTPTEQCSIPLTFKVPAAAVACNTELTAGTLTFNVISRPTVDTPIFSLAEGTYKGTRTVTISCATTDALVEYKLGESGVWTMYVNPIVLTEGETTVYARATKTDYIPSAVVHATYTIEHDDNLLKNGYFDDGLDGWTVSHSDMVSVENGVLTVTNYHSGNDLQIVASLKDGVTLKPKTKYRLSFNMNVDNENLKVKVVPGGNKSTSYTASGSYEFETTEEAALSTFMIYISSPKYLADSTGNDIFVNGTFDNFELSEVGGSTPTTPTESSQSQTSQSQTSQSQTEPIVTSQTESSESSTSTPTGERTKKAQWVTTTGVSDVFHEFKWEKNNAKIYVHANCPGMKDGSTAMTWTEFLASIGNVPANQYFEIAFTHASNESFYGVVNDGSVTALDMKTYNTAPTLVSADDLKIIFETNGALTYEAILNTLELSMEGPTGVPANIDIICTVTLWEGDHGGSGETSESETSASETSTSTSETSEPETFTNLIVNGNFANGLNGWTVNNGGTATVQNGVLTIPSQEFYPDLKISASLISGYTIKQNTQYTLKFDMTSSNPDSLYVKIRPGVNDNGLVSCKESGTYTFTTTADVTTDKFEIWIFGARSIPGLSATFDNFILVEGDHIPDVDDPNPPVTETYTVTVTGGNADKTTAAAGETITLTPPTTAPEGQEFKGWNVTAGGVTVTNNTFTMPAANVTIEADYEFIEYSISVSNGNANGKSTAHLGETIQLNADSPEIGKVFAGWTVTSPVGLTLADASATMTTFTMPAADVVVEAKMDWVEHNITIHVNNDAWGSASISTGVTQAHYHDQLTLKVTPADGYELSAVSFKDNVTSVGADNKFSMPDTDVDIYVDFVKSVVPTHNVTITGGIVNGGTGTATIAEGETVTITASDPDTGYAFTGWTVTSPSGLALVSTTASTTTFTMPKADVAITANFAKQNYNVTLGTVQNGTISASKATAQYSDAVTLTATPATGYVFKSWSVTAGTLSSSTTNPATLTMPASNVIVTATFEKQTYAVTVSNDTTKGTASASVSTAAYGDTVTLTASAKTGYTFAGWTSSDVSITNASSTNASFTMPAKAVTVTATYNVDTNTAIASWTSDTGIYGVEYQNGTATLNVASNTTGLDSNSNVLTFEAFVNNNISIGANQYMKITYTKTNGSFGNARRAATTLAMNAYSGGSYKVSYADDATIVVLVKGAASKTSDPSFTTSWTNASGVPANADVTCKVEIFNFTTDPLASISESDKTQSYNVTVTGGTASPASAAPGTSVTVTATVPSGQRFTGWTVDGTDYLYVAKVEPGSTTSPLTFTMPYNNVKLTANFETVQTEPTQPPVTGNLIKNGDFSNGTADWSFETLTVTDGVGYATNGNSGSKGLRQNVALEIGKTYTLTADVTVTSGTVDLRIAGVIVVNPITSGHVSYTFTANAQDVQVLFGGAGAAYTIDNIVLVEGGSTPVTEPSETTPTQSQPSGGDLIVNGNFANGTTGWTFTGNAAIEGGKARLQKWKDGNINQDISVVAGTTYTVTINYDGEKSGLHVPVTLGGTSLGQMEGGASSTFTTTYTATSTGTVTLTIGKTDGTLDGYCDITNVSVIGGGSTPATEPTTQAPKYKVTLGSVTGGTITASKTTDVAEGDTITLTASPASGYTFGGWNVTGATVANASNATTTFTMPKGDVTVSATFNASAPVGSDYTLTLGGQYKTGKYSADVADLPASVFSPSSSVTVSGGKTVTIVIALDPVYKGSSKTAAEMAEMFSVTVDSGAAVSASYQANADNTIVGTFTFTMPSANTGVSILVSHPDYHVPVSITVS